MKKIFTLALLSAAAICAGAQERAMRVHMADGSTQDIPVSNVSKITFVNEGEPVPGPGDEEKMVDMGVSVKWAAWNVGATKPSDYGNFYAYGEIEPKDEYTIDNYIWQDPDWNDDEVLYEQWERYYKLGATMTGTGYDVAHVKWGDQWRMPTREEWKELINNCSWSWTAVDGVAGCMATSKVTGNKIFFPAAGNMVDAEHTHDQLGCFYWTSSEYDDYPQVECRNYRANLDATNQAADGYDYPEVGFSVRAVYGPVPEAVDHYFSPSEPVDLGLSVKWAPYNLGANSETGKGTYFAWGELAGKYYTHRFNYKWYNPLDDSYADLGESICGTEYDCATRCWGEDWRMPTAAEFKELIEKCTWTRSGYSVVVTGPNGNRIVLPACEGMNYRGEPTGYIRNGYYWSGDVSTSTWANGQPKDDCSQVLRFNAEEGTHVLYDGYRGAGYQVRPVYAGK